MHNPINILIVEDEELGARKLVKLLMEINPEINILDITEGIASTVRWFENTTIKPDLVLMDIELCDGQSFEIFSRIQVSCPVIFTTSYDEHALRAFKLNSIDYLLKPVKKEELDAALQKWNQLRVSQDSVSDQQGNLGRMIDQLLTQKSGEKFRSRFLVKHANRFIPVFTNQIAYIYSSNKLTFIKTRNDQRYLVDYNLDDVGDSLDPTDFFRANRQFILGSQCIREVHSWFNGKMKVMIHPESEEEVIISRERAREFREWLGE
jgi:DNA-binding LytR/AlgR family response regulator